MVGNKASPVVCECLESRRLMAVTTISDPGGRLEIVGTDESDSVEISTNAAGQLLVNGASVGAAADFRDIRIDLGAGDDGVFVHDLQLQNNLEIQMGAGLDAVVIGAPAGAIDVAIGNELRVETGEDDDVLFLLDTNAKRVDARTGGGRDLVITERVTTGSELRFETDDGDDTILTLDLSGKRINISGGADSDLLQLAGLIAGKLNITDIEILIQI